MTGTILLEPEPRNTAPALGIAALAVQEQAGDASPLLLVLPSDALLKDEESFQRAVMAALPLAKAGRIVTFGIPPTAPESGFGYIRQGKPLEGGGYEVARFVEKPERSRAEAMLAEGGYLWNSGMFLLDAACYLEELERFAPDILRCCRAAWMARREDGEYISPGREFLDAPADSIDYAVMEHTDRAVVCLLETEWADLGSWEALWQTGQKDSEGNVCTGDVLPCNAHNCYLYSSHRLIAALSVDNLAVIETPDAVLVADRSALQEVKTVVRQLKATHRPECELSSRVYRPWGSYESLALDSRFQVKRIMLNPGAQISLQKHYHRAEHWVIVRGTAEVTCGDTVSIYTENQSTFIPLGVVHRLKNPGKIPLVIIEIQSGSYFGEDDIIRLEDQYGRERE